MKTRGKVVRDTSAGNGLLSIDGQQYAFGLEGMWKSDVAPQVNMVVDVVFDEAGQVQSLTVVPDNQLAREQALRAAREKGAGLGRDVAARFGVDTLVGMAALVCGWFVLNTVSVRLAASYNMGLSLWKILGVLNAPQGVMNALSGGGGSAGFYGFLAVVALAGPLLPFFLKDARAHLAGWLPLAFLLLVCVTVYMGISDGVAQAQGAALAIGGRQAASMAAEMVSSMTQEALRAISIGIGGYLSVIASLYFAGRGTIRFLSARA